MALAGRMPIPHSWWQERVAKEGCLLCPRPNVYEASSLATTGTIANGLAGGFVNPAVFPNSSSLSAPAEVVEESGPMEYQSHKVRQVRTPRASDKRMTQALLDAIGPRAGKGASIARRWVPGSPASLRGTDRLSTPSSIASSATPRGVDNLPAPQSRPQDWGAVLSENALREIGSIHRRPRGTSCPSGGRERMGAGAHITEKFETNDQLGCILLSPGVGGRRHASRCGHGNHGHASGDWMSANLGRSTGRAAVVDANAKMGKRFGNIRFGQAFDSIDRAVHVVDARNSSPWEPEHLSDLLDQAATDKDGCSPTTGAP